MDEVSEEIIDAETDALLDKMEILFAGQREIVATTAIAWFTAALIASMAENCEDAEEGALAFGEDLADLAVGIFHDSGSVH